MSSTRPPLVLCSGSLGSTPLDEKFRAAAAVGFEWVSVYGRAGRPPAKAARDAMDALVATLTAAEI